MTALIIISVMLIFFIWLFITPMRVIVDTQQMVYVFHWVGIAQIKLIPDLNDIVLRLNIFFWEKDFHPLQAKAEKKKRTKKKKKRKKVGFKNYMRKGSRLLKSCEIKTMQLNIDTDNYILNGYLWPVFYFLSNKKRQLSINFKGEAKLLLIIENRLYRMLKALIF